MSTLDQWEAEAKELMLTRTHTDCGLAEANQRILVLIDLIRKKDETLQIVHSHIQLKHQCMHSDKAIREALVLTEELK